MTISQFKRIELTKRLACMLIGLALAFTLIDTIYGELKNSFVYYMLLTLTGCLSYGCCLVNRQTLGACVGLVGGNLLIFVFATDKAIMDGVLLLYIPTILCTLVLLDAKLLSLRILFCGFTVSLVFVAHYIDYPLLTYGTETALKYPVTFFIDFFAALLISISVLQFVVNVNAKVERSLLDNQRELHNLSGALKKSQARLVLANKGSRIGIYEWNIPSGDIYTSKGWKSLLGYAKEELESPLSSDIFFSLLHPDDKEQLLSMIKHYLPLGKPFEIEVRRKMKDGQYRWFLDRGMVTREDTNELDVLVGTTMDINERKINELEASDQFGKLQQTNRELDAFVYNASHDLRSPLNSILGLLSIAVESDSLDEIKMYLANMERSVKVLDEFIMEISMYTQNAKQGLSEEPVVIWVLLQEVLESLRYSTWYQDIQITCDVPRDALICTDKARLRIVFANLIANAIKYQDNTKEKPYVHISTEQLGKEIHILIEDNGIGIGVDYQERIFEMFYRAYAKVEGSGLGLYITSEIVNRLKGRLFLCSALGEGTAIKLVLPQKMLT